MMIEKQASSARTLRTLAIDVRCIQEADIRDSSFVIHLTFISSLPVISHLLLSEDLVTVGLRGSSWKSEHWNLIAFFKLYLKMEG